MKYKISWACGTYEGKRVANRDFVGRPVGKRPFGRHKQRWEDETEVDLQEVRWRDWIDLAQGRDR